MNLSFSLVQNSSTIGLKPLETVLNGGADDGAITVTTGGMTVIGDMPLSLPDKVSKAAVESAAIARKRKKTQPHNPMLSLRLSAFDFFA